MLLAGACWLMDRRGLWMRVAVVVAAAVGAWPHAAYAAQGPIQRIESRISTHERFAPLSYDCGAPYCYRRTVWGRVASSRSECVRKRPGFFGLAGDQGELTPFRQLFRTTATGAFKVESIVFSTRRASQIPRNYVVKLKVARIQRGPSDVYCQAVRSDRLR